MGTSLSFAYWILALFAIAVVCTDHLPRSNEVDLQIPEFPIYLNARQRRSVDDGQSCAKVGYVTQNIVQSSNGQDAV